MQQSEQDRAFVRRVIGASIQLAILSAWVTLCGRFVLPFFFPVLWGAIIATAVWPLFKLGFSNRPKLGAAVFAALALALLLVPSWLALESIASRAIEFGRRLAHGDLALPPPNPRVATVPVVGDRIFNAWQRAFDTPSALVEKLVPQVRPVGQWLMQSMGHLLGALLQSVFAVIIAAVFLANAESSKRAVTGVVEKLLPERGEQFTNLAGATVRSVAQGVLGIALLQSLAAAAGLVLVGVPAAGAWSALVLALAVMQLPPLLVLGPVAVWVFTTHDTVPAVLFLLWSLLVSASDGLLKPFLLGRGVGVPTLVILMGAIGGMVSDGIIGLFVGSVVLAVGYQILAAWVRSDQPA
ncbi:MAG TPA: AI-2E family transporter [Polyangiales bacterium]|nr:AI-2E family transporter [Polyangiales bacterium]